MHRVLRSGPARHLGDAVRTAGFGEAEVVEIVALTAQVLMTNFMNSVADTEIDVPIAGAAA